MATIEDYNSLVSLTTGHDILSQDVYFSFIGEFKYNRTPYGFKEWLNLCRSYKLISMKEQISFEVLFRDGKIAFRGKTINQM